MPDKKKRGFYRDYLNDYKPNASGGYDYQGRIYALSGDIIDKRRFKALVILFTVLAVVFAAAPEIFEPTQMSRSYITIIPWAASVIAVFLVTWASVRLVWRFNDLKEYVYKKTVIRLPFYTAAACASSAAAMIAQLVYIIIFGLSDKPFPTVIRPVFSALCACVCLIYFLYIRRQSFTVIN